MEYGLSFRTIGSSHLINANQQGPEIVKSYLLLGYSSKTLFKLFMVILKVLPEKVHVETFNFWSQVEMEAAWMLLIAKISMKMATFSTN